MLRSGNCTRKSHGIWLKSLEVLTKVWITNRKLILYRVSNGLEVGNMSVICIFSRDPYLPEKMYMLGGSAEIGIDFRDGSLLVLIFYISTEIVFWFMSITPVIVVKLLNILIQEQIIHSLRKKRIIQTFLGIFNFLAVKTGNSVNFSVVFLGLATLIGKFVLFFTPKLRWNTQHLRWILSSVLNI